MSRSTRHAVTAQHASEEDISPSEQTDTAIAQAIRAGDRACFARLFQRSFADLWRYARAITKSSETAEEVVDDVFAWLWDHRDTWHPPTTIRAYLFRAVRNRALNAVASVKSVMRIEDAAALEEMPVAMGQGPARQDDLMETHEIDAAIQAVLDALPAQARAVVAFRWQQGMSWEEVAEATGLSADAARMKHARALHILRARLPHLRG